MHAANTFIFLINDAEFEDTSDTFCVSCYFTFTFSVVNCRDIVE